MPDSKADKIDISNRQRITRLAILVVVVGIVVGGWLWWSKVYQSPSNVFWGMIRNSLSTSNFTKEVAESSSSSTLKQLIQVNLGQSNTAHAFSTLVQSGNNIKTEEINTPTSDYVRYTKISTNQKSSTGQSLDFSSVNGVWGVSATQTSNGSQVLEESMLGIVPLGNVTAVQRGQLMNIIKKKSVYAPDFSSVEKQVSAGRLQYVYSVKVNPEAYISLLKAFAGYVGITSLKNINPASYAPDPSVTFLMSVDVLSRNLTAIVYPGGSQQEVYGGYGLVQPPLPLPTKTIPLAELQNKLQSVK